jgi:hypothetical protein
VTTDLTAPSETMLSPQMPSPKEGAPSLVRAYDETRSPYLSTPTEYSPAARDAAKLALDRIRHFSAKVSDATLREWLAPIPAVVRNSKSEAEVLAWLHGVKLAVGRLEAGAFTAATQRDALQTFKFFPSAADVYEILAGPAVEIREHVAALRRIAGTQDVAVA